MALVDNPLLEIDKGNCALLILLDLSVVLDTVDHEVLLKCLHNLVGIPGTTLNWFHSFLARRFQMVMMSECLFSP